MKKITKTFIIVLIVFFNISNICMAITIKDDYIKSQSIENKGNNSIMPITAQNTINEPQQSNEIGTFRPSYIITEDDIKAPQQNDEVESDIEISWTQYDIMETFIFILAFLSVWQIYKKSHNKVFNIILLIAEVLPMAVLFNWIPNIFKLYGGLEPLNLDVSLSKIKLIVYGIMAIILIINIIINCIKNEKVSKNMIIVNIITIIATIISVVLLIIDNDRTVGMKKNFIGWMIMAIIQEIIILLLMIGIIIMINFIKNKIKNNNKTERRENLCQK